MSRARFVAPALLALCSALAQAEEHGRDTPLPPPLPKFQQECGACHLAYPPGLLPAASWRHLMETLPRHFGVDASLDAATARELGGWLAANAGTGRRTAETPPQDRPTQSAWFARKHREIAPATWTRAAVKSPANCTACHPGAEQGDFDEHQVRIPR